jgi:hypothetical protein
MCVIAVCENGTKLTRETFHDCFYSNGHGAGFAWIADGAINFAKGFMDEKLAWRVYKQICDHPHVAHFRLVSAGEKCRELTHPFLITQDSELVMNYSGVDPVLFHNGTITNWKALGIMVALARKKPTAGKLSDTRVMAIAVSMAGENILDLDGGKYVVALPGGFVTYGDPWTMKDGINFSNTYFSYRTSYSCVGGKGNYNGYFLDEKNRVSRYLGQDDDETEGIGVDLPSQLKGVNNEVKTIDGSAVTYGRFYQGVNNDRTKL